MEICLWDPVPTMTTYDIESSRLTADDIQAIRCRIHETVRTWVALKVEQPYNLPRLRSIAMWAIGCNHHDLRDSELDMVDDLISIEFLRIAMTNGAPR